MEKYMEFFLYHKIPKKRERKTLELKVHFYGEFCGSFRVVIIVNTNFCRLEGAAQERIFWQILLIYSAQSNFSNPGLIALNRHGTYTTNHKWIWARIIFLICPSIWAEAFGTRRGTVTWILKNLKNWTGNEVPRSI